MDFFFLNVLKIFSNINKHIIGYSLFYLLLIYPCLVTFLFCLQSVMHVMNGVFDLVYISQSVYTAIVMISQNVDVLRQENEMISIDLRTE